MSLPAEEMREETEWGFEGAPEGALLRALVLIQRNAVYLTRERLGPMKEWLKNEKR